MAFGINISFLVCFLITLTVLQPYSVMSAPQVPCFFIFGDSLVDNGNNNQLAASAKVNYLPYGIDFPRGPTGRFTNGRNTADFLAQFLGFDSYIPPFATAQGKDVIEGVNYASGGAGIRSETGYLVGDRISLDKQLLNHNLTISNITNFLGNGTSTKDQLSKCLYFSVIGSNDYLNNYFIPQYYNSSSIYTPDEYATVLIDQYSQQLRTLYNYGARKVAVSGLGQIGCAPGVLAQATNGSLCVDEMNDSVQVFNEKLKLLVNELNCDLTDAEFIYIGAMDLSPSDLVALGISFVREPCCNVSVTTGQCIPGSTPCSVRELYAFYDSFHPTEVVNEVAATAAYIDLLRLISDAGWIFI